MTVQVARSLRLSRQLATEAEGIFGNGGLPQLSGIHSSVRSIHQRICTVKRIGPPEPAEGSSAPLLASEIMERRHYTGRPDLADLFLELQAYCEECHNSQQPPSGRWMIHLVHRRHFFDAARGTMFTVQHIYQLQLEGYSFTQVQSFYHRVNYARQSLPLDARPDDFKLGHWLFLKIKGARSFEHEVRPYKRAGLDSK